jgi:predicted enzyme related to lactoylglutathione lyase
MLKGLRTVIFPVANAEKAKEWYTSLLGRPPYFDQPYYIGYNVGGFELGLDPNGEIAQAPGGAVAYWGVDNIESAFKRLSELNAEVHSEIVDVGDGIRVASVRDPFGNVIGIIENPQFRFSE